MTKNNLWPIYHDRKRGGNLKFTQVCKVEGNLKQLGRELQAVLGKTKDEVIVKGAIGQVCVKVWHSISIRRRGVEYMRQSTDGFAGTS